MKKNVDSLTEDIPTRTSHEDSVQILSSLFQGPALGLINSNPL